MGSNGRELRSLIGLLAGVGLGTMSLTLVFLGMRSVMDIGGACADGGPYVSAQPCPDGVPLAMIGGIFSLFGAAGLIIWFGPRFGRHYVGLVALGWPALFLSLGFNFIQYAFEPGVSDGQVVWGWLIPGVLFWLMGGVPLVLGLWGLARYGGGRALPTLPGGARFVGTGVAADDKRAPGLASPAYERTGAELVSELERLSGLHDSGGLSDAEFAAAKTRIIDAGHAR